MDWQPVDAGATIGAIGSEDGTIIRDDEHQLGARIPLEAGCRSSPYAITCGIYGSMCHATLMGGEVADATMYGVMGEQLAGMLQVDYDSEYYRYVGMIEQFCSDF